MLGYGLCESNPFDHCSLRHSNIHKTPRQLGMVIKSNDADVNGDNHDACPSQMILNIIFWIALSISNACFLLVS